MYVPVIGNLGVGGREGGGVLYGTEGGNGIRFLWTSMMGLVL